MKVNFSITEREYLRFAGKINDHHANGPTADAPDLQLILADESTYPLAGNFYVANRQVDQQTGTIQVQALFPNPDGLLRPGLYAKVRAPSVTVRGAVLVPARAVQETQGIHQVAVVLPEDRKSTRLNSSHDQISYAVFCLKKKNT